MTQMTLVNSESADALVHCPGAIPHGRRMLGTPFFQAALCSCRSLETVGPITGTRNGAVLSGPGVMSGRSGPGAAISQRTPEWAWLDLLHLADPHPASCLPFRKDRALVWLPSQEGGGCLWSVSQLPRQGKSLQGTEAPKETSLWQRENRFPQHPFSWQLEAI